MIRNQFTEMNAPKDSSSVNKYVIVSLDALYFLCFMENWSFDY